MDASTTSPPSRIVWTGTLLHKCHPLATLNAKTATGLACAPPESLHVQQKIQFKKFAAQLLPSTIQNKSTQLSCNMQHFDDGGRGFQPCVLTCDNDDNRKWSRFADFLHKDNSVGVATAEGRPLDDSKVCLFLIPALLLYPYLDAQSSKSSERLFGLFSWHLSQDSVKKTNQLDQKIKDESKPNGLDKQLSSSHRPDTLTKPQSSKTHGAIRDTHTTLCPSLTEPIPKKPPSYGTDICKPTAATLLHEVHIEEMSNSTQPSSEDVSAMEDSDSHTTIGSPKQTSKKSRGAGISKKVKTKSTKAKQSGRGSAAKGGAQLKVDVADGPQKRQMSSKSIAAKQPVSYKLSAVMLDRLLRTKHLQPLLKLKRIKRPPDPTYPAPRPANNPAANLSKQYESKDEPNLAIPAAKSSRQSKKRCKRNLESPAARVSVQSKIKRGLNPETATISKQPKLKAKPDKESPVATVSKHYNSKDKPNQDNPSTTVSEQSVLEEKPSQDNPSAIISTWSESKEKPNQDNPAARVSKQCGLEDKPNQDSPAASVSKECESEIKPEVVRPAAPVSEQSKLKAKPNKESLAASLSEHSNLKDKPSQESPAATISKQSELKDQPNKDNSDATVSKKNGLKDKLNQESPPATISVQSKLKDKPKKDNSDATVSKQNGLKDKPNQESPPATISVQSKLKDKPKKDNSDATVSKQNGLKDKPNQESPPATISVQSKLKDKPKKDNSDATVSKQNGLKDKPNQESPPATISVQSKLKDKPKKDNSDATFSKQNGLKDKPSQESPTATVSKQSKLKDKPNQKSSDASVSKQNGLKDKPKQESPSATVSKQNGLKDKPNQESPSATLSEQSELNDKLRLESPASVWSESKDKPHQESPSATFSKECELEGKPQVVNPDDTVSKQSESKHEPNLESPTASFPRQSELKDELKLMESPAAPVSKQSDLKEKTNLDNPAATFSKLSEIQDKISLEKSSSNSCPEPSPCTSSTMIPSALSPPNIEEMKIKEVPQPANSTVATVSKQSESNGNPNLESPASKQSEIKDKSNQESPAATVSKECELEGKSQLVSPDATVSKQSESKCKPKLQSPPASLSKQSELKVKPNLVESLAAILSEQSKLKNKVESPDATVSKQSEIKDEPSLEKDSSNSCTDKRHLYIRKEASPCRSATTVPNPLPLAQLGEMKTNEIPKPADTPAVTSSKPSKLKDTPSLEKSSSNSSSDEMHLHTRKQPSPCRSSILFPGPLPVPQLEEMKINEVSKPVNNLAASVTVTKQPELKDKHHLEKSSSNWSSGQRQLHISKQPSPCRSSILNPGPVSLPKLQAMEISEVKSPEVADFHDPFDCDIMPQMPADFIHETQISPTIINEAVLQRSPDLSNLASPQIPSYLGHMAVPRISTDRSHSSHTPTWTAATEKHVTRTLDINKNVNTANFWPMKSSGSTPKPAGPIRIPLTGRHYAVNTAKDPRQLSPRQDPSVKIDMIFPDNNQTDYLENLIKQDLQKMSRHNALPSQDRRNKRKISYEDYVSKHPKVYPKIDSYQQTEPCVTKDNSTMARLRKPHRHASVQVNAPPKSKDPVYDIQQMAMKQSVISALGALITRLRTGMTINTQITAILTLEKIIDIISKTARFDLEDKLEEMKGSNSSGFLVGDHILTPSLPTSDLPGILEITTDTQAQRGGLDSNRLSVSEDSTPSMVPPPRCKVLETESAMQISTTSASSDCKMQAPKFEPAAHIDMEISPVSSPSQGMVEIICCSRPDKQNTGKKESLDTALQTAEVMTSNSSKMHPQKVEAVVQTETVDKIKDSPDSPVASPSERTTNGRSSLLTERKVTLDSALNTSGNTLGQKIESGAPTEKAIEIKDSPVIIPNEHMAKKTSDATLYKMTDRKVTVGPAHSPQQQTISKLTNVSSKVREITELQTAQSNAVADSLTRKEKSVIYVKEDNVTTSSPLDQNPENINMVHHAGQTTASHSIPPRRNGYVYMNQASIGDAQPTSMAQLQVHSQEPAQIRIIPTQMSGQHVSAPSPHAMPHVHNQQPSSLDRTRIIPSQKSGQPVFAPSPHNTMPVPHVHNEQPSSLDQTRTISSQISGQPPAVQSTHEVDNRSYRAPLYKDLYPMDIDRSREIGFDTTRDTNHGMAQVGNVPPMAYHDYRGRNVETIFSQTVGPHSYSHAQEQPDTRYRNMETDKRISQQMMAGNYEGKDQSSYVPAVYTNVHSKEEENSRGMRLNSDHQRENRDTSPHVTTFERHYPANKEGTARESCFDDSQQEVRNTGNPYIFLDNPKPGDCSSYVPAMYTNVHVDEEESIRGRFGDQIRNRDPDPSFSQLQGGNSIAMTEEYSRGINLNQNESRNAGSPYNLFQVSIPDRGDEIPRRRNSDLSHQEKRNSQYFDHVVHEGPERVIESVHYDRLGYWDRYSGTQETVPKPSEVKEATTDAFGPTYAQCVPSSNSTFLNNQYRSQESTEKEAKDSISPKPNMENTFASSPQMTVEGKPKRRVEIMYEDNNQQTVEHMGSQPNQEGSVTNSVSKSNMASAKAREISHNVQDLRNIIIEAQRLSAQRRDHKEDLFETNEERTVQDATYQDLTGIKVTLRKKMATDVKDTIAVINKCLHGSEDKERRFVMLGGQLPIKDAQAEPVKSKETFTEPISYADSTKQVQQDCVTQEQSQAEKSTKTLLQAGCEIISSDEENLSCAESYREDRRNNMKPTTCIEQEIHHLKDNYKSSTPSIESFHKSQEETKRPAEKRIMNQSTDNKKAVQEYPKPNRTSHSPPPKTYHRVYNNPRTTRRKPDPPSRIQRDRTDKERFRGKTLNEMRNFFTFVTSWKDGTWKSLESLKGEAIRWHKRISGTCKTFKRVYESKTRAGSSSLQWDGETLTMIEARLQNSQLHLATAMATYITMSSVYENTMTSYSKEGGRQQKRPRSELHELLNDAAKTLDEIRDAYKKYGSVVGVPKAWLTTILEMRSACVRKSETLRGLINEREKEEQQRHSSSRQHNVIGPDYIDSLQTESNTLTDLLANLAKLQELPPEELQQLERYGLPEHVLKECLHRAIQGLDGSRLNSLDKEASKATDQSEYPREQSFNRAYPPQNDIHSSSQLHRDEESEEKSYNSIGYWHSKLNSDSVEKGRKRSHEFSRYDRENDVNKTRIRHIRKTPNGELWTYHDSYEDTPAGYKSQYRQHIGDRHSMDRSSHNSSIELSISSDEEPYYKRGKFDQREGWSDWRGKTQMIDHDTDDDVPPWKRNRTTGRAGTATDAQNQHRRPGENIQQFTGGTSNMFETERDQSMISKPTTEPQKCCTSTSNDIPDDSSHKAQKASNEVLQENEQSMHKAEKELNVIKYANHIQAADIAMEKTYEESNKHLASSIPELSSNIDLSDIELPPSIDNKQSTAGTVKETKALNSNGNPSVPASNSKSQNQRPKISFTIGSGKQKTGGMSKLPGKVLTEDFNTSEVANTEIDPKLKDPNQTSDSKPIKVPGHLTTKFGKLVSLNVVPNNPSNALKEIGVKYGGSNNGDDSESSDVSDSSEESKSDSSDSESSDCDESTSFPSHGLSGNASTRCSTKNKILARSDPLPVEGKKFLQILGNQSQRRVASAVEAPPALRAYIDKTTYRASLCPFGTNCRKGDSCWAAHDQSEVRKNLFKRLRIFQLQDRTMWIDIDDAWRLNELNCTLPTNKQGTSQQTPSHKI